MKNLKKNVNVNLSNILKLYFYYYNNKNINYFDVNTRKKFYSQISLYNNNNNKNIDKYKNIDNKNIDNKNNNNNKTKDVDNKLKNVVEITNGIEIKSIVTT